MNWLEWHTLEIGDDRIIDVDRVRELADAERIEDELREDHEDARDRLAERLRSCRKAARRRGEAAGRREGLAQIASAFASDRRRWDGVAVRLRDAVERVLHELAPSLPPTMFVEAALRSLLASRDDSVPWVIHANHELLTDTDRFMADTDGLAHANIRAAHASYLDEGVWVVETPDGVVELRGDIERALILEAIRNAVLGGQEGQPS